MVQAKTSSTGPAAGSANDFLDSGRKSNRIIHVIILVILTFALYANCLAGQFVWDDRSITAGLPDSPLAVFQGSLTIFGADYGYYRPLARLSLWFDHAVWGDNPFGFHLTNVILHLTCVLILYWFVNTWLGTRRGFIAGLVFAALAVHTENVSFISGRMDILAALFLVLSLAAYARLAPGRRTAALVIAAIAAIAAMLAKESAAVYPLLGMIMIWIRFPAGQRRSRFIDIALVSIIAIAGYALLRLGLAGPVLSVSDGPGFFQRLGMVPQTLALYIQVLILPINLNARHDLYSAGFAAGQDLALPLATLLVTAVIVILVRRKNPYLVASSLWFLAAILPVLNIIPLRGAVVAERFLYLPSIGWALILAGMINDQARDRRIPAWSVLIAIIAVNAYFTVTRNPVWHDEKTFFTRMAEQSPRSAMARHNLGYAYFREGDLERAEIEYKKAIDINPRFPDPHATLGDIYYRTGRWADALKEYELYLELYPSAPNRRSAQARIDKIRALLSDQN